MQELEALKAIDEAFSSLDQEAQVRTLQWLASKYSVKTAQPARGSSFSPSEGQTGLPSMTAKAVAMTLDVRTGPELVCAAAGYLTVILGQETFSRQTLLDTMKTATGFYKPTYSNNLSAYLDGLCKKGTLIETGSNVYAMRASASNEMTAKLQE